MVKLMGSPTSNSTFAYQKGTKNTSFVDLLLSKGIVDSHSLHKIFHSFPKVVPSEKTSITTGIAIVDNTGSTIQVGGHTPRVVFFDTSVQPVILGVQFAKKMGMLDSKLPKSMWQIRTSSGSVKEVFGETSDLIALNFCRNPTLAKCGGEAQHLERLRIWSPPGLPNVQSSTTRGKTPRIGVFLVSLERY
jgi:hypothetical protein